MSLEDLAIKTVMLYGTTAGFPEIGDVLHQNGVLDESGELSNRILDLVQTAIVKVKVRLV